MIYSESEPLTKKAKDSVKKDKSKAVFKAGGERLVNVEKTGSNFNTDLAELIDQLPLEGMSDNSFRVLRRKFCD